MHMGLINASIGVNDKCNKLMKAIQMCLKCCKPEGSEKEVLQTDSW
jgi:hypothetical protein